MSVDVKRGEKLPIHINMTFPALPCEGLSLVHSYLARSAISESFTNLTIPAFYILLSSALIHSNVTGTFVH